MALEGTVADTAIPTSKVGNQLRRGLTMKM